MVSITEDGIDEVEFLISTNPGEPLKPLAKIISGGESSRIMLALKSILAKVDKISCLIFDEIDAGIGGRQPSSGRKAIKTCQAASNLMRNALSANCKHRRFSLFNKKVLMSILQREYTESKARIG